MEINSPGKWMVVVGAILIISGIVYHFWGDKFHFLGRLPGDIRIEKENFRFYFPITTLLLLSLLVNLTIRFIQRLN